jgi:hypothetical protein
MIHIASYVKLAEAATPRKWRLHACGCARRWGGTAPREFTEALEVAERFADGRATDKELANACHYAENCDPLRLGLTQPRNRRETDLDRAARALWAATRSDGWGTSDYRNYYQRTEFRRVYKQVLVEVVGSRPSPPEVKSAWRTDAVLSLARQMYESRDFGSMPVLADALEDAGCDCADVLDHCRDPQAAHVRGCWIVDPVLGKS